MMKASLRKPMVSGSLILFGTAVWATAQETETEVPPAEDAATAVAVETEAGAEDTTEEAALPVSPLPDLAPPPAATLAPDAGGAVSADPVEALDPVVGDVDPAVLGEATEMVLKDGRVLKDYQIHSWNKTALTIFHRTGAANVPAHLLPDHVVKAYRMDPKLSVKQQEANRVKRTEQAMANLRAMDERRALRKLPTATVEGAVSMVKEGGVILSVEEPEGLRGKGYQRIGGMIYNKAGQPVPEYRGQIFGEVWVTGHPLQGVVVDGDVLRFQGRVQGRHQVEGKTYPSLKFEKAAP